MHWIFIHFNIFFLGNSGAYYSWILSLFFVFSFSFFMFHLLLLFIYNERVVVYSVLLHTQGDRIEEKVLSIVVDHNDCCLSLAAISFGALFVRHFHFIHHSLITLRDPEKKKPKEKAGPIRQKGWRMSASYGRKNWIIPVAETPNTIYTCTYTYTNIGELLPREIARLVSSNSIESRNKVSSLIGAKEFKHFHQIASVRLDSIFFSSFIFPFRPLILPYIGYTCYSHQW